MSFIGKRALKIAGLKSVVRNIYNGLGLDLQARPTYHRYRNVSKVPRRNSGTGYEADGKTSVQILNQEADAGLMIDSYSQLGFRLNNGMIVLGPIAIFPRSVLSWNVGGPNDVDEASLVLFSLLVPKLDILVVGVGDNTRDLRLSRELLAFSRASKVNVEVLPTEQACTTFNFLNAEGRYVAGAMIPPNILRHTDDDVVLSKIRQKRLYGPDTDDAIV